MRPDPSVLRGRGVGVGVADTVHRRPDLHGAQCLGLDIMEWENSENIIIYNHIGYFF